MKLTLSWHPKSLRYARALILVCVFLITSRETYGRTAVTTVRVDDGIVQTPVTYDTATASMPSSAEGSNLAAYGVSNNNLGTFDIVIVPSAALSGNAAALAAFNQAAQQWESVIADPITVTINADFSALGPGILGSTGSVLLSGSFNNIRGQMVTDAADESDDGIVASLPTAAQFSAFVPAGFAFDGNVYGTKANLKAMGFAGLDGAFGATDANIAFSTLFSFDFDRSNGITAGQFDFEGVATHEIGHALGFISAVDDVDFVLPGTTNQLEPTPLDLFRFRDNTANDPATPAQFTTFPRSMVPGATEMFDQINPGGGADIEVLFSTGKDFGDGQQASHWKDSLSLGIMDPTAAPGELLVLRLNDIRSMDLIGYEIAVPEAGSLSLLLVGGVLTLAWRRR